MVEPKMRAVLFIALAGLAGEARAETPTRWALLPARSDSPPPRDPTLVRLSTEINAALGSAMSKEVILVSRELADDACPSPDAKCPRDVAVLLNAERVVSLYLAADYSSLELRLYGSGLEKTGSIPCRWAQGLVSCEHDKLSKVFAKSAVEPAEPEKQKQKQKAAKAEKAEKAKKSAQTSATKDNLDRAWKKLGPRLERCKSEGWGSHTDRPTKVSIQFRIDDRGRAVEVRLDPRGLEDVPAFSCMARAIESIRLPEGAPSDAPARYPLPSP
jgi:hypothetical protein